MKTVSILFLFFIVLSCGTKKNAASGSDSTKSNEIMITAVIGEKAKVSDPMTISSVSVNGNTMTIEVTYSGGCGEHSFQVIGSSMIAKSMPPIRSVQLVHAAKEDQCKKMIMQTIKVDLSALAYKKEKGSEIYLTLDGWKDRIKYTFD